MILVVQTNIAGVVSAWLVDRQSIRAHRQQHVQWHGSDQALALIDKLCAAAGINPRRLQRIIVVRGPGAFTAVRTGLIIANTLGHVLRVPVAGVVTKKLLTEHDVVRVAERRGTIGELVRPVYGRAPNISKPQRRQASARR